MTEERLRRWRLLLGSDAQINQQLNQQDQGADAALSALYDDPKQGRLGPSSPSIVRWLRDIRKLFPEPVVSVMQRDAITNLNLVQFLLEKETLRAVHPDPHLAVTLLRLSEHLPPESREAAREVVKGVVSQIAERIRFPMEQCWRRQRGGANRRRNVAGRLDWDRTLRANLKHMQRDGKMLVETKVVKPHGVRGAKEIVIAMDQSGSMGTSLLYAGVYASVLASLPTLRVRIFAFSTEIADLSEHLSDPVELLLAARLNGGTDIAQAVSYADQIIERPSDTVFLIITDLYEGGREGDMLAKFHHLVSRGVRVICLLALDDEGEPAYSHSTAQKLADMGIPSFSCTPDSFPDLLAQALHNLH